MFRRSLLLCGVLIAAAWAAPGSGSRTSSQPRQAGVYFKPIESTGQNNTASTVATQSAGLRGSAPTAANQARNQAAYSSSLASLNASHQGKVAMYNREQQSLQDNYNAQMSVCGSNAICVRNATTLYSSQLSQLNAQRVQEQNDYSSRLSALNAQNRLNGTVDH